MEPDWTSETDIRVVVNGEYRGGETVEGLWVHAGDGELLYTVSFAYEDRPAVATVKSPDGTVLPTSDYFEGNPYRFILKNFPPHGMVTTLQHPYSEDASFGDSLLDVRAIPGQTVRVFGRNHDRDDFEGDDHRPSFRAVTTTELKEDDPFSYAVSLGQTNPRMNGLNYLPDSSGIRDETGKFITHEVIKVGYFLRQHDTPFSLLLIARNEDGVPSAFACEDPADSIDFTFTQADFHTDLVRKELVVHNDGEAVVSVDLTLEGVRLSEPYLTEETTREIAPGETASIWTVFDANFFDWVRTRVTIGGEEEPYWPWSESARGVFHEQLHRFSQQTETFHMYLSQLPPTIEPLVSVNGAFELSSFANHRCDSLPPTHATLGNRYGNGNTRLAHFPFAEEIAEPEAFPWDDNPWEIGTIGGWSLALVYESDTVRCGSYSGGPPKVAPETGGMGGSGE